MSTRRAGVRAAGRDRHPVRLRAAQRAPAAAVGHRQALRPADRRGRDRQELRLPDRHRASTCSSTTRSSTRSSAPARSAWRSTSSTATISIMAGWASSAAAISPAGNTNGRPIETHPTPKDTPKWGAKWKQAVAKNYLTSLTISTHGAVMSHRGNYLDLDPTYRDAYGQPLLRMTFDFTDNEHKMSDYLTDRAADDRQGDEAARDQRQAAHRATTSIVPYQTTHNTGGAIMGTDPKSSAVNRYLQSWDAAQSVRDGRLRVSAEPRLQPDRHGRRADLLGRRRHQEPVPEEPRPAGAGMSEARSCKKSAYAASAAIALTALTGAAMRRTPRSTRSSAARYWSTPAIASPATPRKGGSRSPAAARSRRRSASSIRPTSRPTATPASAPGRDDDFYRAMHYGVGPERRAPLSGVPLSVFHQDDARGRDRDLRLSQHACAGKEPASRVRQ